LRYTTLLLTSALALVLTTLGHAENNAPKDDKLKPASGDKAPGIHEMVIISGNTRTTHYFSKNGSPAEQNALRSLERAEKEAAYAESLLDLRRQYVSTEAALEARRRQAQLSLYGITFETTNSGTSNGSTTTFGPQSVDAPLNSNLGGVFPGGRFLGGTTAAGIPGTTPFTGSAVTPGAVTTGATTAFPLTSGLGFPFFGGGFGGGFGYGNQNYGQQDTSTDSYTLKSESKVSRSLAHGIGDEGQFKRDMVAQMAKQANSEYVSSTARAYENAVTNVVGAVHSRPKDSKIVYGKWEEIKPRKALVILKDKERLSGVILREDSEWIVIKTKDSEERIRTADVARMSMEPQE
jgi:hypothetical protein